MKHKLSLIIVVILLLTSCDAEDSFDCDRNAKASVLGTLRCFTGTALYNEGIDGSGNPKESFDFNFVDVTGGNFQLYVNSVPYQPPFTSIGLLQINTDYSVENNHANLYIQDIVQLLSGKVRFSTIDRTARKISGTHEFTYVINTSSGNKNVTISGEFTEISF
jgi:hypothetical protein